MKYEAPILDPVADLLDRALAGEAASMLSLVSKLRPVIQTRVSRILLRYRGRLGRVSVHELDDLVQHVFMRLLTDDKRELRAWSPDKGLSLLNYVGLIAERDAISVLRVRAAGALSQEDPDGPISSLTAGPSVETQVLSRDLARRVVTELRADLGPRGAAVFEMLFMDDRSVEDVCQALGMTADAAYAWRSRISQKARTIAATLMSDAAPGERRPGR